ncbi:tetratricopeptide repeat protein [Fulvivirga sp. 29W222]|uniref:Tetratricopeptide repeat protein n=1 Tax=Fulvivirga marina TaxID=2494733 RepID=A0A937FZ61_9BACT|nr:tetratricopeptide repeat protein [Fulvivirga marina]MBL6447697.1 tetratricopeptide repeat protein [Fulvivirga marina]
MISLDLCLRRYSLFFLFLFFFGSCSNTEEITPEPLPEGAVSLEAMLTDDLGNEKRVEVYYQLYKEYRSKNVSQAEEYASKALSLASQIQNLKYEARSRHALGLLQQQKGEYKKAINSYLRAADLFESSGDIARMADATNNIGMLFLNVEGYTYALQYFKKAANIYAQNKDFKYLSVAYSNVATCYSKENDYVTSSEYLNRAIDATNKTTPTDVGMLAYLFNKKGNIHYFEKDYELAISNYEKALAYTGISNHLKSTLFDNLANAYMYLARYGEAEYWIKKGNEIENIITLDISSKIQSYNIEGELYQLQGHHEKAVKMFEKAINEADETAFNEYLDNTLDLLSKSQRALAANNVRLNIQDVFRINDIRQRQQTLKESFIKDLHYNQLQILLDKEVESYHSEVKQAKLDSERITIFKSVGIAIACLLIALIGTVIESSRKIKKHEGDHYRMSKIRKLFQSPLGKEYLEDK